MRVPSRSSILSTMDTVKEKISSAVPSEMKKKPEETKLRVLVAFLFVVCFSAVITTHVLYHQLQEEVRIFSRVRLEESTRHLMMFDEKNSLVLTGKLGVQLPHTLHPYSCIPGGNMSSSREVRCLEWKGVARLEVEQLDQTSAVTCHRVTWTSLTKDTAPMDCWPVGQGHGHWYGGGESLVSRWPLDDGHIRLSPFVTGDEDQTEWGNVIRKYFLNSKGLSITVEDDTPLSVSLNDDLSSGHKGLCLQANFDDFPYYYHRFSLPVLDYTVCTDGDLADIHLSQLDKGFWDGHRDSDLKELYQLLQLPLWQVPHQPASTTGYTLAVIQQYLQDLLGRTGNLSTPEDRGYLLLDHHWQDHMGDLKFSKTQFPSLRQAQDLVREAGLKLALTVNPFVSVESENFQEGVRLGLFVMERNTTSNKNIPALTWFKDAPVAALLDITNPATVAWLKYKLATLALGDASEAVFFLDTGNTFHTPHYFTFHQPLPNPDLYKEHFIQHAMEEVKVIGVSGASSKRPKAPAFVWLTPLTSSWSSLQTIIPNLLHLGVIGYPFINPGPIGGHPENSTELPNKELYIRWWQLATFLPQMHFLTPPSAYRDQGIAPVARLLMKVKQEVVNPLLKKFGQEAMESSLPLIRPLWMLDPADEVSQNIDDQVLVGDTLLVAPILQQGQTSRDVYLPSTRSGPGVWKRNDGTWFEGGQWARDNKVELHQVLYFERQPEDRRPGHS